MITSEPSQSSMHWIINSGASDYMTHCLSNMLTLVLYKSHSHHINMPIGAGVDITHIGYVLVLPDLTLKSVLCVPCFKHSLLYVQKLVKDNDCQLQFSPRHCYIIHNSTNKLLDIGEAHQGLYLLKHVPSIANYFSVDSQPVSSPNDPTTLWNNRLGHAPLSVL